MISFGSCIYPTLGSVKVSPSRVASPENYKHQTPKVSGVTPRPELPPITLQLGSPMKKSDFHRSNDRTPIQCMQAIDLYVKTTKRAMLTLSFSVEKIK